MSTEQQNNSFIHFRETEDQFKERVRQIGKCDEGFPVGIINEGEIVWTYYDATNPYMEGTERHDEWISAEAYMDTINGGGHVYSGRVRITRILPFYYYKDGNRSESFVTLVGELKRQ